MRCEKLNDMIRGWFVGDFSPVVHKTDKVEVAVKSYKKGEHEEWHYHKVAKEITVIVAGSVLLNNKQYAEGDIIVIEPGEGTDFFAVTDVITTVVKIPGVKNDKYIKGE